MERAINANAEDEAIVTKLAQEKLTIRLVIDRIRPIREIRGPVFL
jgi:hypothetical protein